jgi:hypothetical protein
MIFEIIESATGDTLGSVNISGMSDEHILKWLVDHGYLAGDPDDYEISRCYPLAEGEIVVLDMETQRPMLKLELPPEPEQQAA